LAQQGIQHVRGAPAHPQTQGKIESRHQTMKNRILLDASPKRSLTFNSDGPDTPLQSPPISLKSFDDGHVERTTWRHPIDID
jgi:hypothetical protein